MSQSRRRVLRWLGISLALPLLESAGGRSVARAAPVAPKKRFIGCFFPSGAADMLDGASGDWVFDGALQALVNRGLKDNVAVVRGFRANNEYDVHWSGTAAFLSGNNVGSYQMAATDPKKGERCGKSFDQYVADLEATRVRSLHAGWSSLNGWDEGHDAAISIRYVNSIAWRDDRGPIQNTQNPREMFTQVFGDGTSVSDPHIQYLLNRRKSVLDGVRGELRTFRTAISAADRPKMDAYESGIREVENELTAQMETNTCVGDPQISDGSTTYVSNLRAMQKIIVRAFQCNVTRAATVMYHEGIGDNSVDPAAPLAQHAYAHGDWERLKICNRLQVGLWSELLTDLKAVGLLEETVVVLGSNMSDGKLHDPRNIPLLVASAGPELRLGQEVFGTRETKNEDLNRNIADLWMDLFPLFGIDQASFGEGRYKNTGLPSNILKG